MREKSVENDIKAYLFRKGIYHFKVHGSKFMEPGIADIIACCNGHFLAIEVKAPGHKYGQSEQQKVHERNVNRSKGTYLLVDSLEEVVEWVENYEQTTSNKVIESSNSSNNSDVVI